MPNIKPVSDLRNYGEVLQDVGVGSPVFLTKNGRGKYALIDIHEYEQFKAAMELMKELSAGAESGEEEGWISMGEVKEHFRSREDED